MKWNARESALQKLKGVRREQDMATNYAKKNKEQLSKRFAELKKELGEEQGAETLNKYYILNEALKIARTLHGKDYSIARLSYDMECPYTTVKRVLSLQKATKDDWALIKSGKIGAHKVAQILMQVDNDKAESVIRLAVDEGWSTSKIKKYRHGDVKTMKLKAAVYDGFARQDVAMKSFQDTIKRLEELFKLEVEEYTPRNKAVLEKKLVGLRNKLNAFLGKLK